MGFSWRKSVSFGPVRLNFSQGGVGVSAGVRGARISTGPRGTYVHVGAGGFRYSHRLDSTGGASRPGAPSPNAAPPIPIPSPPPGRVVESIDPGRMVASSADELAAEIVAKSKKVRLTALAIVAGALLLLVGVLCFAAENRSFGWSLSIAGAVALMATPWTSWWDRRSLTTHIFYDFDALGSKVHESIGRMLDGMQRADSIWSVRVEQSHGDWKRNAGAGVSIQRGSVRVGWGLPSRVEANVRVGHLTFSGTTLYFFPDRLLVYGLGAIRSLPYVDILPEVGSVDFIEDGRLPQDAAKVGSTWLYVNKGGGPDRRFNNNRQLAIMRYGVLDLSSSSGLRLRLHISTTGLAAASAAILGLVQEAIRDMERRGVPLAASGRPGLTEGDAPPLLVPAMGAARAGASFLKYEWLDVLPDWAVPMVWGVVFALPATAIIFLIARGQTLGTWAFAGASLLTSGCGVPVLMRARHRYAAVREAEDRAERVAAFRDLLRAALRAKPIKDIEIETLMEEVGVSTTEAGAVADELYRKMADWVCEDGVITRHERKQLDLMAFALKLPPDRCAHLEAEAATQRYKRAVKDVIADWVVTPEESKMLDEMRANLGVEGPHLAPGELMADDR